MEVKSKWAAAVFIVMALVLALGMAVVAAPAGEEAKADVQEWSSLLTPNPISLGIMPGQDIVLMELSPNVATDNTIYAITVDPNAAGDLALYTPDDIWQLRKSTNGGYWWETMGTGLGAGMPAGSWTAVDMAVAPDDPNYIVVAMTDGLAPQQTAPFWAPAGPPFTSIVYVSADGGATFSTLGALGLPATE
ncbi:MAG: hypothetical protein IMY87_04150, partial [Chloroflexi bacterium]|nr:hypothetical protein [Chloroflexota bacterium]